MIFYLKYLWQSSFLLYQIWHLALFLLFMPFLIVYFWSYYQRNGIFLFINHIWEVNYRYYLNFRVIINFLLCPCLLHDLYYFIPLRMMIIITIVAFIAIAFSFISAFSFFSWPDFILWWHWIKFFDLFLVSFLKLFFDQIF